MAVTRDELCVDDVCVCSQGTLNYLSQFSALFYLNLLISEARIGLGTLRTRALTFIIIIIFTVQPVRKHAEDDSAEASAPRRLEFKSKFTKT